MQRFAFVDGVGPIVARQTVSSVLLSPVVGGASGEEENAILDFAVGLVFSETASMPVWLKPELEDFWVSRIQPFLFGDSSSSVDDVVVEKVWKSMIGMIKSHGHPFAVALLKHFPCFSEDTKSMKLSKSERIVAEALERAACSSDATTLQYSDNVVDIVPITRNEASTINIDFHVASILDINININHDHSCNSHNNTTTTTSQLNSLKENLMSEVRSAKSAPEIIKRCVSFLSVLPTLTISERSSMIVSLGPVVTTHLDCCTFCVASVLPQ